AGGDGTVRKITKHLLKRKLSDKTWPIALLPLGTANNIATTLGIKGNTDAIIESWNEAAVKKFDVGKIENFDRAEFFLEGYGYGLFPYLIKAMKKVKEADIDHPEVEMRKALELFHESIFSYKPKHCHMKIDGVDYSGNFLMVEIMNTRLIGPNLFLSPHGDPGDGEFEVIMVAQKDKEKLAAYVSDKLNGREEPYQFARVKAEKLSLSWEGTHVHVDDEILKIPKYQEVEIEMRKGLLEFMVPANAVETIAGRPATQAANHVRA
ncbi:MAG TPA: diacylglycerol kinase family protein, partial [Chitinophagaceae bacterium]